VPLPESLTINNDTKPFKQVSYPLLCSEYAPPNVPAGTHYSATCTLMVSVVGKNKLGSGSIKFELSVEDDMDSHFMTLNHFSFTRYARLTQSPAQHQAHLRPRLQPPGCRQLGARVRVRWQVWKFRSLLQDQQKRRLHSQNRH
jgi:hypothetical protein